MSPMKDLEKIPKGKQKYNDKWYCNYTNINTSPNNMGSEIPELINRVEKPSYGLWRHKTKLRQIVTS